MNISDRIKELRAKKNWSQKDLSFHSGVSSGMIGGIENNTRQPSHKTLVKLAECFGVSVSYLANGKEDVNNDDILDNFLNELIKNGIITDVNNIPPNVHDMIIKMLEAQIMLKLNKINK